MKKGIFFSLDATAGVLIIILGIALVVSLLFAANHSNEDIVELSRIARDVYEVQKYGGTAPAWIKMGSTCDTAGTVAVESALTYDKITGIASRTNIKVCY